MAEQLRLRDLVRWSGARTSLSDRALARSVGAIWMDSRKVQKGDVFLALRGEGDDGHRYVAAALEAGAVAAIVQRSKVKTLPPRTHRYLLQVSSPLKAVQRMATKRRAELGIPVVALTGSNGKTTTRLFIAEVLKKKFRVGETSGNWNNHIGVPLSILRWTGKEQIGVVEMGANHVGEISVLSRIARPDIALITNIGYAHVGLFGGLTRTTDAKFEITLGLKRRGGLLLINGDDSRLNKKAASLPRQTARFGLSRRCDLRAGDIEVTGTTTSFTADGARFELSMPGRHFIYSALPAVFLGRQFGIDDAVIAEALRELRPADMRGEITERKGVTFIVDCYNANPSSMKSGLALLDDVAGNRRKVAVLGDMLELGAHAKRLHRQIGRAAVAAGVAQLVAVGAHADELAQGAEAAGLARSAVYRAENTDQAHAALKKAARRGSVVLLKASRGIGLEKVFKAY